jgi:hypothetical protein
MDIWASREGEHRHKQDSRGCSFCVAEGAGGCPRAVHGSFSPRPPWVVSEDLHMCGAPTSDHPHSTNGIGEYEWTGHHDASCVTRIRIGTSLGGSPHIGTRLTRCEGRRRPRQHGREHRYPGSYQRCPMDLLRHPSRRHNPSDTLSRHSARCHPSSCSLISGLLGAMVATKGSLAFTRRRRHGQRWCALSPSPPRPPPPW